MSSSSHGLGADRRLVIITHFYSEWKNKSVWLFETMGYPNHEIFSTKNRKNDHQWSIPGYDFPKIPCIQP